MSLVPYPDIGKLPEEVHNALAQAPVQLNIFKMMAQRGDVFRSVLAAGRGNFGAEAGPEVARTGDPAGS
jgi:hypothetical protein